ncbi:MAG: LytR/AlgR family response regulator transcription factor [Eubacterium sp.]
MIKLLICDDNPEITKQIKELISIFEKKYRLKFQIDIKNSGDFILKDNKSYDIAIVDIEMPGINGLRLSEKLKELNSDTIVIVLTSFQNYLDSAMRIHVFRYLSKPIDKNRFYSNLKEAVEEYRLISKTITITNNCEVHLIKTKDILYIENQNMDLLFILIKGIFIQI